MVGPGRCWLLPEDGWPAMPFMHRVRDTVVRNQARTVLYKEPWKGWWSERDIGNTQKAAME
jgi:hypothetical protein